MAPQDIKKEEAPTPMEAPWLVTFADLLSLMLTFFVLLFSMAEVKVKSWEAVTEALSKKLNPVEEKDIGPSAELNVLKVTMPRAIDLSYLESVLKEKVGKGTALDEMEVQRFANRLVLSLPAGLLFRSGSATIGADAEEAVKLLGDIFRFIGNRLEVHGHTDPDPVGEGGYFPSNWELSLARALAVANILQSGGYMLSINTYGNADSRFYDINSLLPLSKRYELSRRVDIVVRESVGFGG